MTVPLNPQDRTIDPPSDAASGAARHGEADVA